MSRAYRCEVRIWPAREWNHSDCRRELHEITCPLDCVVITAESVPAAGGHDDGVIAVAHVPFDLGTCALASVGEDQVVRVAEMMTEKFGNDGWHPVGQPTCSVPGSFV